MANTPWMWSPGTNGPTRGRGVLGPRRADAQPHAHPHPQAQQQPAPDRLEREMVRRSVDTLTQDRTTCVDCGRTPLVGEQLHVFAAGATVCELCRPLRREQPVSTHNVRHSEYGCAVRVTRNN